MKFAKILASCLFASLLAFSMAGCASEEVQTSENQVNVVSSADTEGIEIYDVGFSQDDDGNVSYAFIAVNPNNGVMANSVVFSIEGYDVEGNMIMGSAETGAVLYPNYPMAFSGSTYVIDPDVAVDYFEVKPSAESISWTEANEACSELQGMFEFTSPSNSRDADGSAVVRGRLIVNNIDALAQIEGVSADSAKVNISVLLADTDGNIIAGGSVDGVELTEREFVENESGEGVELSSASFSVSIPNAPSFKEAICFAVPA